MTMAWKGVMEIRAMVFSPRIEIIALWERESFYRWTLESVGRIRLCYYGFADPILLRAAPGIFFFIEEPFFPLHGNHMWEEEASWLSFGGRGIISMSVQWTEIKFYIFVNINTVSQLITRSMFCEYQELFVLYTWQRLSGLITHSFLDDIRHG